MNDECYAAIHSAFTFAMFAESEWRAGDSEKGISENLKIWQTGIAIPPGLAKLDVRLLCGLAPDIHFCNGRIQVNAAIAKVNVSC